MRPTLDKLFKCIDYILLNDILPELSSPFAMRQAMMLSHAINGLAVIWEKTAQFPLIEENKDLRDVLLAATRTLEATRRDYKNETLEPLTQKIHGELQREHLFEEQYPSLQSLLEENCNLKESLVQTITVLEEISQHYKSQALDELRKKIRAHLRKHLDWQLSLLAVPSQT